MANGSNPLAQPNGKVPVWVVMLLIGMITTGFGYWVTTVYAEVSTNTKTIVEVKALQRLVLNRLDRFEDKLDRLLQQGGYNGTNNRNT